MMTTEELFGEHEKWFHSLTEVRKAASALLNDLTAKNVLALREAVEIEERVRQRAEAKLYGMTEAQLDGVLRGANDDTQEMP